ncbi:hypothetical protein KJ996_06475 [Patescibacteria group bacterium]|nr:hypothetical protein [Patescibacteria group bacterium]
MTNPKSSGFIDLSGTETFSTSGGISSLSFFKVSIVLIFDISDAPARAVAIIFLSGLIV